MITASSLARRLACPSSDALARAENFSEAAQAGRATHADLARLDRLPESLAKLVPASSRAEVRLAYNIATHEGRIIGEGEGRAYGNPGPLEIVGSADVVGLDEHGNRVIVIDWKGGNDQEPAESNPQLLFYALAACSALGRDDATIRIVYTRTDPPKVDEAHVSALDLAVFAQRLETLMVQVAARHAAKARGEVLDTVEGPWCHYCPSKHVCPSKNAMLVQFASRGLAPLGDSALTTERAAAAYREVMALDQIVKDAKSRLATYVDDHGPIDLGNGFVYGRVNRRGNEELSGAVAEQAIAELAGESAREFAAIAIEKSTTKAGIKRAAQAVMPTGGAAKLEKSIIDRIRALGGATHKAASRPLVEYRREDAKPDNVIDLEAANALLRGAQ